MKLEPTPDYDPAIDEPNERWSLSWRPEGRCDEFTNQAILACAPATSGVYGLFNFDCQIFIGESANIREVLLRLESETDFQSPHLRPTGFTFELCPQEFRKQKAAELIAQYRPALQTTAAPNECDVPANDSLNGSAEKSLPPRESATENHQFPVHIEVGPNLNRRSRSKRARSAVFLGILLSAGAVGYHFFPHTEKDRDAQSGAAEQSSAYAPSPQVADFGQAEVRSKSGAAFIAVPNTAKSREVTETGNGAVRLAKASGLEDSALQKIALPAQTNHINDQPEKKWSVQVSAAPAKDAADRIAQDLLAKGYDSYVVRADVKGQAFYRVRAGRFNAREDAESVRQSLMQEERYRDAYVTSD